MSPSSSIAARRQNCGSHWHLCIRIRSSHDHQCWIPALLLSEINPSRPVRREALANQKYTPVRISISDMVRISNMLWVRPVRMRIAAEKVQ